MLGLERLVLIISTPGSFSCCPYVGKQRGGYQMIR